MANMHLQLRGECSETLRMGKTAPFLASGSGESGREKNAGVRYKSPAEPGGGAVK